MADSNFIYRGTTPTMTIKIPYTEQDIEKLYISFEQSGAKKAEFSLDDEHVEMNGNVIEIRFTQEDTFRFSPRVPLRFQVTVLLKGGTRATSNIMQIPIEYVIKTEVI